MVVGFSGIVTRRPLVLQLHKLEQGMQQDYAEFLHLEKKRFTDFGMLLVVQILLWMELLIIIFFHELVFSVDHVCWLNIFLLLIPYCHQ